MNTLELKGQAYDLLAQIEYRQRQVENLKLQFEEVNKQIQESYTTEDEKSELSSDESSD